MNTKGVYILFGMFAKSSLELSNNNITGFKMQPLGKLVYSVDWAKVTPKNVTVA